MKENYINKDRMTGKHMSERDVKALTAVHHAATFAGFFAALYFLCPEERSGRRSFPAKLCLALHMLTQGWGMLKILAEFAGGKHYFAEACRKIAGRRALAAVLIGASVLFKTGIPLLCAGRTD